MLRSCWGRWRVTVGNSRNSWVFYLTSIYLHLWAAQTQLGHSPRALHLLSSQRKFRRETPSYGKWTFSLINQRSLCPVGMCLKRSWSHILTSPKEIMKSHSDQPRDHCVQLARALRDHEVTFSLAQSSLCPVGMCLDHEVTFSLAQRSLCPVGTCGKRSWSHILTTSSPEIIVSICLQLACAVER